MSRARAYRALLFLYPRRFRREYGAQMLQLFRDERREYGAPAWLTATPDLFATLPVQHLEAFMHLGPQGRLIAAAAAATTVGIVAFAFVGGGFAASILIVLLMWIVLSLLKEERGTVASGGLWWTLTLSGMGGFALLLVVFGGPWPQEWRDEFSGDLTWYVGFYGFVLAIVTFSVGILTGLVQRVARRPVSH